MSQPKTLTELQIQVLRWIAAGCHQNATPGDYARISAGALRGRGYVTTKGQGSTWSARITPSGREYLAKVDGPNPPTPRKANGPQPDPLVAELIAAGGTLRVTRKSCYDRNYVDYDQWAAHAHRWNKVPAGSWLEVHAISSEEREIVLVTPPPDELGPVVPIPVPLHVARYDQFVREFRDLGVRREISMAQLPRALRILQAIKEEATRRGHVLEAVPNRNDYRGTIEWAGAKDGHFSVTIGRHTEVVRFSEVGVPNATYRERPGYYAHETHKSKQPKPSETDAGATGNLRLELLGYGRSARPSKWAARKNATLEESLGEFFWEVEARAYQAEQRRLAEQRQADERRRNWEIAKADAVVRLNERHRIEALMAQLESRRQAREIREFCNDALSRHPTDTATREWTHWARTYAASIDPLTNPPEAPAPVTSAPASVLQPFMQDDWSATEPVQQKLPRR